jgi:hypothetical protein
MNISVMPRVPNEGRIFTRRVLQTDRIRLLTDEMYHNVKSRDSELCVKEEVMVIQA